jgi:hypothetical protein
VGKLGGQFHFEANASLSWRARWYIFAASEHLCCAASILPGCGDMVSALPFALIACCHYMLTALMLTIMIVLEMLEVPLDSGV